MRYKTKVLLSYLMTLTLILGCILVPNTVKANEYEYSKENATIWKTYSGSVNGIERTLIAVILEDGTTSQYIRIGDAESNLLWYGNLDVGLDQYGAVWILDSDHMIMWWSYEIANKSFDSGLSTVGFSGVPNPVDPTEDRADVESLDIERIGEQVIIKGYKTFSGEICPLPSFDEMKEIAGVEEPIPEPLYIPKGMESLITPSPIPVTATPGTSATDTPIPTPGGLESSMPKPTPDASEQSTPTPTPSTPTSVTPMPVADTPVPASDTPAPKVNAKKVSIKTEKKAKVLYEGDNFIGQYTLKKGVLTWKGPKKKGKMKGVKKAGFNEKSKKLVIWTKKGDGYVLSFKTGKMKRVVKKKVKKFIYSGKFVTKIKTTSGKTVNLRNK